MIVDVWEQGEWEAGHVKGAILAPLSKLKNQGQVTEMLKLSKSNWGKPTRLT
ncbi:MAG: rhodanese-like domain-containing protein [Planctomycetota bacterium]|nr:rhodanese-like domain-containing protein [Planctomycetota bacterium]